MLGKAETVVIDRFGIWVVDGGLEVVVGLFQLAAGWWTFPWEVYINIDQFA